MRQSPSRQFFLLKRMADWTQSSLPRSLWFSLPNIPAVLLARDTLRSGLNPLVALLAMVFFFQKTLSVEKSKIQAFETSTRWQLGSCHLGDLWQADKLVSCSTASAAFYQVSSLNHADNYRVASLNVYTSLHWWQHHSVHVAGQFRQISTQNRQDTFLATELLAYQWGKLGRDPVIFSIGKQELPFGIHWRENEALLSVWQDDSFYFHPHPSMKLTYQGDLKFGAEVGLGSERDAKDELDDADLINTYSLRSSYDMTSEHGTRWVFSLGGKSSGLRSYGVGLIFRAPKGASTQFEWIRSQDQPEGGHDFAQIFRLLIAGQKDENSQTSFAFDLSRNLYRQTSLIYSHNLWQFMTIDSALIFHRLDEKSRESFYLVLGINGHV